jgi:hypothetical protein
VAVQENVQVETGTYHGVSYRFRFTDGSGTFAGAPGNTLGDWQKNNWKVLCGKDPIDDKKSCAMHLKELWIVVFVGLRNNPNKQALVQIGGNHYPGSSMAIRINEEKPFVANLPGFSLTMSSMIIQKLKTNPKVATRYQEWPKDYPTDDTFQVFGFSETYEYINWAVQQIK